MGLLVAVQLQVLLVVALAALQAVVARVQAVQVQQRNHLLQDQQVVARHLVDQVHNDHHLAAQLLVAT